jgi:hypothetical protein
MQMPESTNLTAERDAITLPADHPLAAVFGKRKDDPMLERVADAVKRHRRKLQLQEEK